MPARHRQWMVRFAFTASLTACSPNAPTRQLITPATAPVEAQTAEEVIHRYVAALGGRDAIAALQTMRFVRTVQNTEDGRTTVQSRTVIFTRRPRFRRSETLETGRFYISDGTNAWRGTKPSGQDSVQWEEAPRLLPLPELDFDRPFGAFLEDDPDDHTAAYIGPTDVGGVQLDAILVRWSDGVSWEFYFEPSSGLCYGYDATPGQPGGFVRVDDYRNVGNVLIPHRNVVMDTLPSGHVRIHERLYSGFEFNLELPEGAFRPEPALPRENQSHGQPGRAGRAAP